MKWAVYWDNPDSDSFDCNFFKSKEEALAAVEDLIKLCEQLSADTEKNLFWDITLMEVKGEVAWGPDGLGLLEK